MDMQFCYILAKWKGSAYNDKVLKDNALFETDFIIPKKKCYLVDARYHNINYLLCPYFGVRYHLKEQAMASKKLINKERLFNFCHSCLQNIVEKIFGITKRRFQILEIHIGFIIKAQVKFILAITRLYNFIQLYYTIEDIYDKTQLDVERLLTCLSCKEKEVEEQDIYMRVNINRRNKA